MFLNVYFLEQEELLAFFKIENKNHSFEICKSCTKKVRDLKTTHDSIESCNGYFNRNGMDSICATACADKYFTRLTYSGVTKTIHGDLDDFYHIKQNYPEAFKIIEADDDQKMRFFNILGRRAHGFICKNCNWIKKAKVQNSALKLPKDYIFKHICEEDEPMASQSSNSFGSRMNTDSNSSNSTAMHSNMSSVPNSQSQSESSRSIGLSVSQSSQGDPAAGFSDEQDSGFRTPDILNEPDAIFPDLELSSSSMDSNVTIKCRNSFTAKIEETTMTLKCNHISQTIIESKSHKCKCPLRYGDEMAQTNAGYMAKILWSYSKEINIADYLANCLNNDLINNVKVPGFTKETTDTVNIKNCMVYNLPKLRNFIIAHKEPSAVSRKKKDVFSIDSQTCRDLIGCSSSISKFKRLSQTMNQHKLPVPTYLHQTIRQERQLLREFTKTIEFKNQKRTNFSGPGTCYGSVLKKEDFPTFLQMFEQMHPDLVANTVALCVLGDEGRGYMKFSLTYSSSNVKVNAQYSIMLLIGEVNIRHVICHMKYCQRVYQLVCQCFWCQFLYIVDREVV